VVLSIGAIFVSLCSCNQWRRCARVSDLGQVADVGNSGIFSLLSLIVDALDLLLEL
jgi:hypothetical protein